MRITRGSLATVACLVLAMSTLQGDRRSFAYSEVIVPGATMTNAAGINAGGHIVGTYKDAKNISHGYLLAGDQLTTIDYPNAAATEARGIGPGGAIVGIYWMPSEVGVPAAMHGYLWTPDGVFTDVNSPDHMIFTIADVLGFQFHPGDDPQQQLLDYLGQRQLLLILDNLEHLLDGAGLLSAILRHARRVQWFPRVAE